jgi:hypothetical protein
MMMSPNLQAMIAYKVYVFYLSYLVTREGIAPMGAIQA